MGVTSHWVKMLPDGTIIRMLAAIACLRFPGDYIFLYEGNKKLILLILFCRVAYSRQISRQYSSSRGLIRFAGIQSESCCNGQLIEFR
jgi:hypothetical protein